MSTASRRDHQDSIWGWRKLPLSLLARRTHTNGLWGISVRWRSNEARIWACIRCFGADSRKQGFVLDWLLPGLGENSVTEYLKAFYLEKRKDRERFKPWLGKIQQSFQVARTGGFFHQLCGSDTIQVLPVFSHNYGGALILSCSVSSSECNALCDVAKSMTLFMFKRRPPSQLLAARGYPSLSWPQAWSCQWGDPGVPEREGRWQRSTFLSDHGCLCRSVILQRDENGVPELGHRETKSTSGKESKGEKKPWLSPWSHTIAPFLYLWLAILKS